MLGSRALTAAEISSLPMPPAADIFFAVAEPAWEPRVCLPVGTLPPDLQPQSQEGAQEARSGGAADDSSAARPARPPRRYTMVPCEVRLQPYSLTRSVRFRI